MINLRTSVTYIQLPIGQIFFFGGATPDIEVMVMMSNRNVRAPRYYPNQKVTRCCT